MLTRVSTLKKINVNKKFSSQPLTTTSTRSVSNDKTYNALVEEFASNLERSLKQNRFSEADKAFAIFNGSISGRKDLTELDYFRGLHSVTQAFAETKGANTPEVRKLIATFSDILNESIAQSDPTQEPVKIAVTGAAGAIGYALLFRIASGEMLGKNVPVKLQLLELPQSMDALKGVVMELNDCAFPLLRGIEITSDPEVAFEDVDYALLVGAQPRTKGMERGDLIKKNAEIFSVQGKALNKTAKKTVKVVVVGNPANTNCLIAAHNAPSIPRENFSAMTKLDHNRGLSQLSTKLNIGVRDIENFAVWGNHSSTQFPSIEHALINGRPAREVINDDDWIEKTFIPVVQKRGAEIIQARGASSAASAASACIDHIREWVHGTRGEWTSMAVSSNGDYGVTEGLFYSFPVVTAEGSYSIVQNLPIDARTAEKLELTHQELLKERDEVSSLLK